MDAPSTAEQLLSTGQVAKLLGVSRQHIVDLCVRGTLPYVSTGTHRRIQRRDVDSLLAGRLTREAERSLWLHRAVAGRMVSDPDTVIGTAGRNLETLQRVHPDGMSASWLARWRTLLDEGVDAVLEALGSRSPLAVELRQNSPFAGVLSPEERAAVHDAFRRHWRHDHAA